MIDDRVRAVLDRLYAEDEQQRNANLPASQRTRNLTPDSGRFLMMLAASSNARWVVEIGSSMGLDDLACVAMRATAGLVIGTELIPERAAEANTNLAKAGLEQFRPRAGGCRRRAGQRTRGTVRPGVIDAEKDDYIAHFELVWPLMRPRGIVVADNVISHDVLAYQEMLRALGRLRDADPAAGSRAGTDPAVAISSLQSSGHR